MSPKVFVSHASEDKERFVLAFAAKLRQKGIDAWVDNWEILPGDSLVDKIFEEGLKHAEAVIVVISRFSVDKPWVREELNAAVVKKINDKSKLIPVVLDGLGREQIPAALLSTVWQRIGDVNSYDAELAKIVMSIYGKTEKPALGTPPHYVETSIDVVPGLTEIDSLILKLSCEDAVEQGHMLIDIDTAWAKVEPFGVSRQDFVATLEVLKQRGYIKTTEAIGEGIVLYQITVYGFDQYARIFLSDYDEAIRSVGFELINAGQSLSTDVAQQTNYPLAIVNYIFQLFESKNYIRLSEASGGEKYAFNVSAELNRALTQM